MQRVTLTSADCESFVVLFSKKTKAQTQKKATTTRGKTKQVVSKTKLWQGVPVYKNFNGVKYEAIVVYDENDGYEAKENVAYANKNGYTEKLAHVKNSKGVYKWVAYIKAEKQKRQSGY